MRRGGQQRRISTRAASIIAALRVAQLRREPAGRAGGAGGNPRAAERAQRRLRLRRPAHRRGQRGVRQAPRLPIITSLPGLADISRAIVLTEISDDRARFTDDRARQAFAGSAPVTRASGKSRTVVRRRPRTIGSPRLATDGRSPPLPDHHRPASTTCADANATTGTPPRCGTCSTGCSANCNTACRPEGPTTRSRPSSTPRPTRPARLHRWLLDKLATSEVSSVRWRSA